jgi:LysM repeat protein
MFRKITRTLSSLAILVVLVFSLSTATRVSAQQPELQLDPPSGPPGTTLTVTGSGFPANSEVIVGPGVFASEPVTTQRVTTNDQGEFSTQVTIPADADPQRRWVIAANRAGMTGASILADFEVTQEQDPEDLVYIVQSGDYLSLIAAQFSTSVNALIRANPGIEDPNRIFPGQEILIPGALEIIPDTGERVYIVQSGDTLSEIAVRFGTTVGDLTEANPEIESPARIFPGQRVVISEPVEILPDTGEVAYIVQSGDTLSQIAVNFRTTVAELVAANPEIENPALIFPGQRITIPDGQDAGGSEEQPEGQALEPILIREPANGSRVLNPVTIRGEADPTHEQHLDIRIYLADGTLLAESFTRIDAELGERGQFEAEVDFDVAGEENAFIQVFRTSARDGQITHLSSTGVTLASDGEEEILMQESEEQRVIITSPASQPVEVIAGGTAQVEGFGLASFEQTLVVEVQDEMGNVVGETPVIVDAPDLGEPGLFEAEVEYSIDSPQPGRIVVRDPSPAFGGDVYLTSVEVRLEP